MVASHLVQQNVRKLLCEYKRLYGVKDLIPKRKQPFTREIILHSLLSAPDTPFKLGRTAFDPNSRRWRSLRALTLTLASSGFRKDEISVSKHGLACDADCLARANLRWFLRDKVYESGSVPPEFLQDPQPGDFAILTPGPSKSDPFDMIWGDKPIWLPFNEDPLAAFSGLAEIELHDPLDGLQPDSAALFCDDDGLPFSGSQLDTFLKQLLGRHYPPETVALYSWHSARIYLATALLAANASRAQIQALCRWQTEESLNIYACIGKQLYGTLLGSALSVRVDAARAATLADAIPFIDLQDVRRHQAKYHNTGDAALTEAAANIDQQPEPDDDADQD